MHSRNRLLLSVAIPILLLVVVAGAFFWQQRASTAATPTGSPGSQKLTPLKLALDWTPNTNHTGIYVALQKGWYREQGIDLTILPYSANVTPDVLVNSNQADVGISSTESIVSDAVLAQPVISLAAIIQHNTSALVTLAKSNLTRPRDLDGKTYASFGAPYENAVISQIIKHDGGKGVFDNVTLNVDGMQALEAGRADFVWVFEGWEVLQAERSGIKLNVFPIIDNGVADYYTPNLITGPKQIKQEPELLRRFMAATARGYEYARTHAHESAQILYTLNKSAFPDSGLVNSSQDFLSPRYADPGRQWGLQDATAWQGYPRFILDTGQIKDSAGKVVRSLDFKSLYTNAFLPRA